MREQTDWDAWNADDDEHPIGANTSLVTFLKAQLALKRVDLAFHACHHRNSEFKKSVKLKHNYIQGAEFFVNNDVSGLIKQEINYLNALFGYSISCFTPPQNVLSEMGYKSVIKAGLNLCGGGVSSLRKEKTLAGIKNILRQTAFRIMNHAYDYPYVLRYSRHNEIIHHYPLHPDTRLDNLISAFERVRRFDGDFVISTHYVEHKYPTTYHNGTSMGVVFKRFIEYVDQYPDVSPVTMTELLS